MRVLLCVFNGYKDGWNWELAKTALEQHRKQFITVLVSETVRLQLDGVDIDFEGKGTRDGDKKAFFEFIKELAFALKAKGKELTVDSFAYKWNAPNQGWWKMMLPHIDALHVMGYSETGSKSAGWRSYNFIKAAAGNYSPKVLIGVPSHIANWEKGISGTTPRMDCERFLHWPGNLGCSAERSKMENQRNLETISSIRQGTDFNMHRFSKFSSE